MVEVFGKDAVDRDPHVILGAAESALAELPDRLNEDYAILSLSRRRDNLPMWAHYCEAHRGFLIDSMPPTHSLVPDRESR